MAPPAPELPVVPPALGAPAPPDTPPLALPPVVVLVEPAIAVLPALLDDPPALAAAWPPEPLLEVPELVSLCWVSAGVDEQAAAKAAESIKIALVFMAGTGSGWVRTRVSCARRTRAPRVLEREISRVDSLVPHLAAEGASRFKSPVRIEYVLSTY